MGIDNSVVNRRGETTAGFQAPGNPSAFENIRNRIADKLHEAAKGLSHKATRQDEQSGMAGYGEQASEWLDQSARYVRQFDYKQANARVREYVKQSPGRSLLIAGAVGLVIGAILRRR